MGNSECVGCSSVERVGVVDVVYHKTGNTIEVTTGSEVGFERVGAKCMEVYDSSGIEAAERVLERGVRDMDISQGQ